MTGSRRLRGIAVFGGTALRSGLTATLLILGATPALAQQGGPPGGPQGGQLAALEQRVTTLEQQLDDALQAIAALQQADAGVAADIAEINGNTVLDLDGYLGLVSNESGHPVALFEGINVQITNGETPNDAGQNTPNGVGNLIRLLSGSGVLRSIM